jgi:serine protease AprX
MLHGLVAWRRPWRRALWRRALSAAAVVATTLTPVPADAAPAARAHVPPGLEAAASQNGSRFFPVIVQGRPGVSLSAVAAAVNNEHTGAATRRFVTVNGVAARVTGQQLLHLATRTGILAITPDLPLRASDILDPVVISPPVISGEPVEGGTLVVTPGSWTGAETLSHAYVWQACGAGGVCSDIGGATDTTLVVPAGSTGSTVRAIETVTDATGGSASAASEPVAISAVVTAPAADPLPTAPASTGLPTIAGAAVIGSTLTAQDAGWAGTPPIDLAYQWQRCAADGGGCMDVAGANTESYVVSWADVGSTLRVTVTATNAVGSESTTSAAAGPVTPVKHAGLWSSQLWPYVAGLPSLWDTAASAPTIAVVDSGVDSSVADLQGRVLQQVTLTSLPDNSPGDGRGHGTFVSSLAAGSADGRAGAAPTAKIVSLDVLDDHGAGQTSDVLAAADWIYAHRDSDGIRVANFSLTGTAATSFAFDPLDRAVERLWLGGVVVVAAGGNYGVDGRPSGVPFAPANDPLIVTVGADDLNGTETRGDDVTAPWSSFGYTLDGFAKPDVGAPGRMIIGPVPPGSTLALERPDRVVEPGLMQLSGTSLAAPIVAGAAADLLAAHPDWTPDQVKGALMLTATPLTQAAPASSGVGEIDAAAASAATDPPNPNAALEQFLTPDPAGGPTPAIDTSAWAAAAAADPSWASTYWGSTYWGSAAWSTTYWGSTYWGSTYWGSTTEGATYWGSTYWGSTYWGSTYWGSNTNASGTDAVPSDDGPPVVSSPDLP